METKKDFLSLNFYRNLFMIPEKFKLSWCIVNKITNENDDWKPAIRIENTPLYISILEGEFKSVFLFKIKERAIFLQSTSKIQEDVLILKTKSDSRQELPVVLEVPAAELEKIYKYRVFSENLIHQTIL